MRPHPTPPRERERARSARRYGSGTGPRGERIGTTERGDIREGGSGREGCGSTHRDRLNSRAARLFFQRSFLSPSLPPFASLRCPPSALPAVPSPPPSAGPVPSWLSYLVLLYVLCLLYVLPSPPSCSSINAGSPLTANHHFQFSVVQRLRHLLSLCPSRASSCPSATSCLLPFLYLFFFI